MQPVVPRYRRPFFEALIAAPELSVTVDASPDIPGAPPSVPCASPRIDTTHPRLDPSGGGPSAVAADLAAEQALGRHDVTFAVHTPACTPRNLRRLFHEERSLFERLSASAALRSKPVRFDFLPVRSA